MRAYFFVNMYLSSIQNGLQSAHCISEMFVKYCNLVCNETSILLEWANNNKTIIILNGGYSENLQSIIQLLDTPSNLYPWATFNEGFDALNGALTCVGIILPHHIYESCESLRRKDEIQSSVPLSYWELTMATELSKYQLAH